MRVLLLLAPLLASCSPALYIPRPQPEQRCIPVIVDGRTEACVSPHVLREILRDGGLM
jgi:hypothetical protein